LARSGVLLSEPHIRNTAGLSGFFTFARSDSGHAAAFRGEAAAPETKLMAKAAKQLHDWRITEIRERGRILGRVRARTAEEAIEAAIREFGITEPHRQRRLAASRFE